MSFRKVLICTALFVSTLTSARAKSKPADLSLSLTPRDGCPLLAAAEPYPNWREVRLVKENRVTKFRRGDRLVEYYPEEIRLHVTMVSGYDDSLAPSTVTKCAASFDPARVQFSASWRNPSRTLQATGNLLNAERHPPIAWCELKCHEYWTFELRLESANVPITDELLLTVKAEDGKTISTLVGRLELAERHDDSTVPAP